MLPEYAEAEKAAYQRGREDAVLAREINTAERTGGRRSGPWSSTRRSWRRHSGKPRATATPMRMTPPSSDDASQRDTARSAGQRCTVERRPDEFASAWKMQRQIESIQEQLRLARVEGETNRRLLDRAQAENAYLAEQGRDLTQRHRSQIEELEEQLRRREPFQFEVTVDGTTLTKRDGKWVPK